MSVNRSPINSPIQSPVGSPLRPGGAPEPGTPPDAPTLNTVTPTNYHTNQIAFTPAGTGEPATSFRLLRSDTPGGPYTAIGGGAASPLDDKDAPVEATSYYVVQARANYANSPNSNEGNGTTPAAPAYAVPTNVDPKAISDTVIEVSWDDITPLADEDRVDIYRGGVKVATVVGLDQKPYADTGLTPNTTYTYELTAGSQWAQGAKSTPADGTTFGPPAAPDLSLDNSAQPWELSWPPVAGADTYRLYESSEPDPINTGTVVYEGALTSATRNVPRPRYWVVTAGNAYGWGDASNSVNTEDEWLESKQSTGFWLGENATGSNAAVFSGVSGGPYLESTLAPSDGTNDLLVMARCRLDVLDTVNRVIAAQWNSADFAFQLNAANTAQRIDFLVYKAGGGFATAFSSGITDLSEFCTVLALAVPNQKLRLFVNDDKAEVAFDDDIFPYSSPTRIGYIAANFPDRIWQGAISDFILAELPTGTGESLIGDIWQQYYYEQLSASEINANLGPFEAAANLTERQSIRQNDGSGDNFTEVGGDQDVVVNGGFDTDTDWTKQEGWSISGGKAIADGTATGNRLIFQTPTPPLKAGDECEITFTVDSVNGSFTPVVGGANGTPRSAPGTYTETIVAVSAGPISIRVQFSQSGQIDNVICKVLNRAVGAGPGPKRVYTVATDIGDPLSSPNVGTLEGTTDWLRIAPGTLPGDPEWAWKGNGTDAYVNYVHSIGSDDYCYWFHNAGTWEHHGTVGGVQYLDGVPGAFTPQIYDDASNLQIGKTGAATFSSGSIFDFQHAAVFTPQNITDAIAGQLVTTPDKQLLLDEGPADTETTFDNTTGSAVDLLINTGTELGASAPLLDLTQDSAVGRPYGGRDGLSNKTLSFDGVGQYLLFEDDTVLSSSSGAMIFAWEEGASTANKYIAGGRRFGSNNILFANRLSGFIKLNVNTGTIDSTYTASVGERLVVVFGYDGVNGFIEVNGVDVTGSGSIAGWLDDITTFAIGCYVNDAYSPSTFFDGQLAAAYQIRGDGKDWATVVRPAIDAKVAEVKSNLGY